MTKNSTVSLINRLKAPVPVQPRRNETDSHDDDLIDLDAFTNQNFPSTASLSLGSSGSRTTTSGPKSYFTRSFSSTGSVTESSDFNSSPKSNLLPVIVEETTKEELPQLPTPPPPLPTPPPPSLPQTVSENQPTEPQISYDVVLNTIVEPLAAKLRVEPPLDEIAAFKYATSIVLDSTEDKWQKTERDFVDATDIAINIEAQISSIYGKTLEIAQNNGVIGGNYQLINDWTVKMNRTVSSSKTAFASLGIRLAYLISYLLLTIWKYLSLPFSSLKKAFGEKKKKD